MSTLFVRITAVFFVLIGLLLSVVHADTKMTGEQIMQKSIKANYYAGLDRMTEGKMTITDKNGSVRIREFKVLRRDLEAEPEARDDQNYFVKFS